MKTTFVSPTHWNNFIATHTCAPFSLGLTTSGAAARSSETVSSWPPTAACTNVSDVAVQPDGRIVVAGSTDFHDTYLLERYRPNGTLDASFGNGGAATGIEQINGSFDAVALLPDGRILAAGCAEDGEGRCSSVVARFTAAGALDTGFGRGGGAITSFPGRGPQGFVTAVDLALQPDGRVVVATDSGTVRRFASDGTPDAGFGRDGRLDLRADLRSVAVAQGGKLVLAGGNREHRGFGMMAMRLDAEPKPRVFVAAKQQRVRHGRLALTLTGPPGELVTGSVSADLQRRSGVWDDVGMRCGRRIPAGRANYQVSGLATIQLRLSRRIRREISSRGAARLGLHFESRSATAAGATADDQPVAVTKPRPQPWADHAIDRMAKAGYRRGGARRAVVQLLADQGCALSAFELEDALRRTKRKVARASIYRIIEELERLRLVSRVDVGDGIARYEAIDPSGDHHHHFVCDECGDLIPFRDNELEKVITRVAKRLKFHVGEHEITLRGLCGRCQ